MNAIPSRLAIEPAAVDVGTGRVLDAAGALVPITGYRVEELPPPAPAVPFERPVAVGHNRFWRNHFHFLVQTGFAAWEWARAPERSVVFLTPPLTAVQRDILALAGLVPAQRHEAEADTGLAVPRALVLTRGYTIFARQHDGFAEYAAHLSRQVPDGGETARRLYVSRRDARKRRLLDETAIEAALARHGFAAVTLTGLSFAAQVRLFRGAEIVVGPHGAGLANIMFCRPGARIVELRPAAIENRVFEQIAGRCGLRYYAAEHFAGGDRRAAWRADPARVLDAALAAANDAVKTRTPRSLP